MLLIFISCGVHATGVQSTFSGTIKQIVCHADNISPICHVQVNGTPANMGCATSNWHYTFDGTSDEGKNFLSILLAAQMSSTHTVFKGQGTCNLASYSQDLRHVYMHTPN